MTKNNCYNTNSVVCTEREYPDANALNILGQHYTAAALWFCGLNIMGNRNYINYPRDSSNGMESRFKP